MGNEPDTNGGPVEPDVEAVVGSVSKREARLGRHVALNFTGQAIPLGAAVLAMPLLMRGLGPDGMGVFSLIWILLGNAVLFDLGLGRAVAQSTAAALSRGERHRVAGIFWSAAVLQLGLGIAAASAVMLGAGPLLRRSLHSAPALLPDAQTAFTIAACALPVMMLMLSISGLLEAAHRFDLTNLVTAPLGVATFAALGICALCRPSLPAIAGILLLLRFAAVVVLFACACHVFPELLRPWQAGRAEWRRLVTFGGWVTVTNVLGPVLSHVGRFMLATVHSASLIAYLAVPWDAVSRLCIVSSSATTALFPRFAAFWQLGEHEHLGRLAARSVRYILTLIGLPVLALIALSLQLMSLWMGPEFAARSATVVQVLAAGMLVYCLAQVAFSLLQACGRPDVCAKVYLLETPFHLVLTWFLAKAWAVNGVVIAWAIREVATAVLLWLAVRKLVPGSWRAMSEERLAQVGGTAAIGVFLAVACARKLPPGGTQAVCIAMLLAAGVVATWCHLLDAGEREHLRVLWGAAACRRRQATHRGGGQDD